MGVHVANGGLQGHGTADPITSEIELWFHWGDKNINKAEALTDAQALTLQNKALESQSAFDTAAGTIASWYAMTGLSASEKAAARARIRAGVVKIANMSHP